MEKFRTIVLSAVVPFFVALLICVGIAKLALYLSS